MRAGQERPSDPTYQSGMPPAPPMGVRTQLLCVLCLTCHPNPPCMQQQGLSQFRCTSAQSSTGVAAIRSPPAWVACTFWNL